MDVRVGTQRKRLRITPLSSYIQYILPTPKIMYYVVRILRVRGGKNGDIGMF